MLPLTFVFLLFIGITVFYFLQIGFRFGSYEALRTLCVYFPPVRYALYNKTTKERYRKLLYDFNYFQQLSATDQEKFIDRITVFLSMKRIEGNDLNVDERMRVRVAACALQVLFGLEEFYLPFFETVRLYNGTFRLGRSKTGIEAIALRKGVICISWPAFEKGYESPHDAYNVGLFAFAQALQMGVKLFDGDDPFMTEQFRKWDKATDTVIRKSRELRSPLLPASMIKNESMFFASGVEYFFEAPEKLYEAHPNLYYAFCEMLWQNPLQKDSVPPRPAEHQLAFSFRKQRKLASLYVLSFAATFLGMPLLIYLAAQELIPDLVLICIFLAVPAAMLLPPLLRGKKSMLSSTTVAGAFGLAGCTLVALLLLNLIPIGSTQSESHRISEISVYRYTVPKGRYSSGRSTVGHVVIYSFEDGAYSSSTLFRTFNFNEGDYPHYGTLDFRLYRGLLGFRVLSR